VGTDGHLPDGALPRPADAATPALRLVLAGVLADLAVGTLFAWSLVAADATAGTGTAPGGVFAGAIVVFAAVLLGLGPVLRRAGPRRLLRLAAAAAGAGLLVAAYAGTPWSLFTGVSLLFGAANGLAYGVSLELAARVPQARRGAATGAVVAAYAAGPALLGVTAPPALRSHGWRAGLAVLAAAVVLLLAVAALLSPPGRTAQRPAARGTGGPAVARGPVVLLWLAFVGGAAPGLVLFAQAVPVAAAGPLGPAAGGLAVTALATGNLAGRLLAGWWSDRIGRRPALATALLVAAASLGVLCVPVAPPAVLAGFLGSGAAYGAVSSLVPAATADHVGPAGFAVAYGRVFTGWGCAGLLAPLAGDQLVRLAAPHPGLLALAGLPLLPAAAAVLLLPGTASRPGDRPRTRDSRRSRARGER
jgi:MFS family permease